MKRRVQLFFLFFLTLLFSACTDYKKVTYFKNISDSSNVYNEGQELPVTAFSSLLIQPDDILTITINTLDPEVNGAATINALNSQTGAAVTAGASLAAGKMPDGYLVNKDGAIDIPVIGTLHVAGLTTDAIKELVLQKATAYFKNPTVNVRLMNFRVTVLGEVTRPGTYVLNSERASVLDALGVAGDLTIYGKRENLMLIRQTNGANKKAVRMDLGDAQMMTSPYFYLKQGDVIYVEPTKGKATASNMSNTRTYAIIGSVLSVLIILISRIKF